MDAQSGNARLEYEPPRDLGPALLAGMFYLRSTNEDWPSPFHFASLLMASALTMFAGSPSLGS